MTGSCWTHPRREACGCAPTSRPSTWSRVPTTCWPTCSGSAGIRTTRRTCGLSASRPRRRLGTKQAKKLAGGSKKRGQGHDATLGRPPDRSGESPQSCVPRRAAPQSGGRPAAEKSESGLSVSSWPSSSSRSACTPETVRRLPARAASTPLHAWLQQDEIRDVLRCPSAKGCQRSSRSPVRG